MSAIESTAPPKRVCRVIVVEDDALIALDLGEIVHSLGHVVIGPAATVEAAMLLAEKVQIDAATLDVQLDGKQTSYPIAAELDRKGVPFMFITGADEGGLLGLFPHASVVRKPFDSAAIKGAIQKMLRNVATSG